MSGEQQEGTAGSDNTRALADEEVDQDLKKTYRQLLVDVHHELLICTRSADENAAHAQRRLVSMQARVASESATINQSIRGLTVVITALTAIQVAVGVLDMLGR